MWPCMEMQTQGEGPSTSGAHSMQFPQQDLDPHVREQAARALFQLSSTYGHQNTNPSNGGGVTKKRSHHRPPPAPVPYPNVNVTLDQLISNTAPVPTSGADSDSEASKIHRCMINDCRKNFTSADKLNRHVLTHSGVKPHECSFCGKRFGRTDHMTKHERTHTGEKPFGCTVCGKKFSRSDKLSSHKKTHFK